MKIQKREKKRKFAGKSMNFQIRISLFNLFIYFFFFFQQRFVSFFISVKKWFFEFFDFFCRIFETNFNKKFFSVNFSCKKNSKSFFYNEFHLASLKRLQLLTFQLSFERFTKVYCHLRGNNVSYSAKKKSRIPETMRAS